MAKDWKITMVKDLMSLLQKLCNYGNLFFSVAYNNLWWLLQLWLTYSHCEDIEKFLGILYNFGSLRISNIYPYKYNLGKSYHQFLFDNVFYVT